VAFWRPLARGLGALIHGKRADREAADEVAHFLEQAAAAHVAAGMTPEAARRAARLEVGNPTLLEEDLRTDRWEHAIETAVADLRHGVRRLRNSPGFTAVATLTLALGIGASTAVFSAAKPVLFESLPYPDASRIVTLWDVGLEDSRQPVTFGTFLEVRERTRSFAALAVMRPWQATLPGAREPERLDGQRVTAEYFQVLGVQPVTGRGFTAADDRPGAPPVVLLGNGLWHRRFGADPSIVGQQIRLDDDPYTVVGVMPPQFENVLEPTAEIWRPLQYDPTLPSPQGREWGHHLHMVGRIQPSSSLDQAKLDLDGIATTPVSEFTRPPWAAMTRGLAITALQDDITRGVRPALIAVIGAVILLLLIVCVNVTNLQLGRAADRRAEFSLRVALGAGRVRLTRQLLTESLVLAGCGGALGICGAWVGIRALQLVAASGLPRASAVSLDLGVAAFAAAFTTAIGVLIGVAPALHASRAGHAAVPQRTRTTSPHRGIRHVFVVAQVALAVVLLVGAGLLFRSVERLLAIPTGFDADDRLSMQVQTSGHRFDDATTRHAFFASALAAVRQIPGVRSAAWTSQLPLNGGTDTYGVHFESAPAAPSREDRGAARYAVDPEYFATLGIPLKRGRLLNAYDNVAAPLAVLLNESFAKRRFADRDPIGQRLHIGPDSGPWYTIVGIVGDVKQLSLELNRSDAVYVTTSQWPNPDYVLTLVVRSDENPATLVPSITRAVWSVDKDQPITRIATLESLVARSAAERRFALTLFEVFAVVALALAALGIYGVLSGSVAERTREIGVRVALGASRHDVLKLVVQQGLILTTIGVAIGVAGATAASSAILVLLFGTSPLDPLTYVSVVAVLAGVSLLACILPARRAAWIDPAITLRAE
jgi:putative ABC transport system permease protein